MIHRNYQIQGSEVHVDMFDDRMEIVSPGGMINGSRIQDLNLKHVPSMRRNEIISDIFGRLHYMDRRGSGIQRILSAYTNFVEQPSFYSDDTVFLVNLPNRGIATPKSPLQSEKSPLQSGKSPLQGGKSPLQSGKSPLQSGKSPLQGGKSPLQGEENNIIKKWKEKGIDKIFREQTIEKLLEFYMRYSSEYSFNRNLLANFLEIAPNSASKIIQKCREIGIMRMEKRGAYFFTDPN